MNFDQLVLTAAIMTIGWCAISCALGILVARSIDVAETRDASRHTEDDLVPRPGARGR